MFSFPYPVEASIQDVKLNVQDCTDSGENMMVYTPGSGYETYYYYTDTIKDLSVPEENWESMGPGWATADGEYVNLKLKIGQGFWLNTTDNKTFTIKSPLSK